MNLATTYYFKTADTDLDKEQCRLVINQAFRDRQPVARKDSDMIPNGQRHQVLSGKNKKLYMLCDKDSDHLLGTALLTLGEGEQVDLADIRYLAVVPSYWGFGLGTQLMRHAEDQAQLVYQKKKILLSVVYHPEHTQAKLVEWYKQQGYLHNRSFDKTPSDEQKCNWFEREYHEKVMLKFYEKNLVS